MRAYGDFSISLSPPLSFSLSLKHQRYPDCMLRWRSFHYIMVKVKARDGVGGSYGTSGSLNRERHNKCRTQKKQRQALDNNNTYMFNHVSLDATPNLRN